MTRSTTVVAVRKDGKTVVASDGQVTFGEATILKHTAKKVRRLSGGSVICGFAGAVADAQALTDKFEEKLEAFQNNLRRAAVEFAKEWRTDKVLRHLNAVLVVADKDGLLLVSGDGNVIEPDDGVAGIGSGGPYALAAARALLHHTKMDAEQIAREAMRIASEICVFTNNQITLESI
jgi:ATP-dependent HslUV protease subunit HslV